VEPRLLQKETVQPATTQVQGGAIMFSKSVPWRAVACRSLPAVLLAGVVSTGAGQERPHMGPRFGVNSGTDAALVGVHVRAPVSPRVEFYPSLDVHLPSRGSLLAFNADAKVLFPARSVEFFTGAGVNVMHRTQGPVNNTDLGLNVLGGVGTRTGWVHPFVEGRVIVNGDTSFQLMGGMNITLGR
jgi:hypothetical protein